MLRGASPESGEIAKSADILRSMSKLLDMHDGGWQECQEFLTRAHELERADGDVLSREKRLDFAGPNPGGVRALLLVRRSSAGWTNYVHGGTQFALILLFIVLEIVVHIAVAARAPQDANAPMDERGKSHRSQSDAHRVLRPLRRCAPVDLHHAFPGQCLDAVAQFVLLSIVVAELVK